MPTPIPNPFDPFERKLPHPGNAGMHSQKALRRICSHGTIQLFCKVHKCQQEAHNVYLFGTPTPPEARF